MKAVAREHSTRARVVGELLDTPAVQEILRARTAAPPGRVGALEAAVRKDPELAIGIAVASVDRLNDALHSLAAVLDLIGTMPAPFVRALLERVWSRVDGEALAELQSSAEQLCRSGAVDRDAVAEWLTSRLETTFSTASRSELLAWASQVGFDAYARALRAEPRLLRDGIEQALRRVPPDVLARTVDSTLDQVADVLLERPQLLRSLGRFTLRVVRGSVRASFR